MTYDASNPEQVAKARREEEDAQKDIDFIVSEPRGRRWVYTLMHQHSHINSPSFVPGSPEATAFNEGARSVGTTLHEQLRSRSPTAYMKMLEENHFNE
tara:strand:+ start:1630 stop:1923 length:294 start_codon:yes stop_codon:yes gene_type:complete